MKYAIGAGLLCCLAAADVEAGCTAAAAASPASYGPISSTLVRTAPQSTSSTSAGLTCTAGGIALLGTAYFKATITSSQTGMLGPSGDVIAYSIYASNNTTHPITRGVAFDFASNGLLGTAAPSSIPLYFTTVVNNVAAGVYTETLNVRWDWYYCTGLGALGLCLGSDSGVDKVSTMTVSMTVVNDCTISAPSISFGSAPMVSSFAPVSQSISVACTKGSAYTVALGDGLQAVRPGGQRRRFPAPTTWPTRSTKVPPLPVGAVWARGRARARMQTSTRATGWGRAVRFSTTTPGLIQLRPRHQRVVIPTAWS